jgi:undecaprenyl phosphate-alpha-L-ara4N flippase subunit ArnE
MTATTVGVLLVVLCGIIEGIAQVFFKKSSLAPEGKRLWIGAGVVLFIIQALIYTGALQFVEVSTAFPIGSIALVIVVILSRQFLRERVTGTRWIGIVLIILGVTLLGAHA